MLLVPPMLLHISRPHGSRVIDILLQIGRGCGPLQDNLEISLVAAPTELDRFRRQGCTTWPSRLDPAHQIAAIGLPRVLKII